VGQRSLGLCLESGDQAALGRLSHHLHHKVGRRPVLCATRARGNDKGKRRKGSVRQTNGRGLCHNRVCVGCAPPGQRSSTCARRRRSQRPCT
jgi:hypothetical protein